MTKEQQIEQELSLKPFAFQQKVEACKALYTACQGRHHDHIQQEMRALGHERWNNRCLYARWTGNKRQPGWPERFGWDEETGRVRRTSPQGTRTLARGKAEGRSLGTTADHRSDPEGRRGEAAVLHSPDSPDSPTSRDFLAWLKRVSPPRFKWDWKFQQYVIRKLEAFERGETKRLMLFVPPRHGKSELVTVRYAAWHLENNPTHNIIIGSYNQRLANRFSRKIRNVW